MLLPQLKRADLWNKKVENIDNLGNLISNLINEFKLKVGQSLSFYELIKEEDENDVKFEEVHQEEEEKKENKPRIRKKRKV